MSNQNNEVSAPTPLQGTPTASGELGDLLALMARLRVDCPWDKKQTNHSLIPYAIEEAYELGEGNTGRDRFKYCFTAEHAIPLAAAFRILQWY